MHQIRFSKRPAEPVFIYRVKRFGSVVSGGSMAVEFSKRE
jgi:hypothetical protein